MPDLFIAYYRVSTARQGESGLGLDAQRRAVADFVAAGDRIVIESFEEVESGKHAERTALGEAMARCSMTGAALLIAKLDRLSRDAHFLLSLQKAGLDFVACDMPKAEKLTVGVMALVAQQEREAISARTSAALQAIRAKIAENGFYETRLGRRITRLGSPLPPKFNVDGALGSAAIKQTADKFAAQIGPTAKALLGTYGSLAKVADQLNAMHVRSARGSTWTPMAVKRVLDRCAA